MNELYVEFYQIIALIPHGRVATYGQIAKLAGLPKHARHVGMALKKMDDDAKLPWHRVINSQGQISLSKENEVGQNIQIQKLLEEGVAVVGAKVNLKQFQWQP